MSLADIVQLDYKRAGSLPFKHCLEHFHYLGEFGPCCGVDQPAVVDQLVQP